MKVLCKKEMLEKIQDAVISKQVSSGEIPETVILTMEEWKDLPESYRNTDGCDFKKTMTGASGEALSIRIIREDIQL